MKQTIYIVGKFSGYYQVFLGAFEFELEAYKAREKEGAETYTEVIPYELNTIYR